MKIRISQLIAKILLKQRLNQIKHCLAGPIRYSNLTSLFYQTKPNISTTFKIEISQFYNEIKPLQWK